MKSPEFARLWADNRVQARSTAVYELRIRWWVRSR